MENANAVSFEFDHPGSAVQACDMLNELGYKSKLVVSIQVERGDLTSALEIAQAHGGRLQETHRGQEERVLASAYGMDGISIPAHTVNEDWPDSYLQQGAADPANQAEDGQPSVFDPSGDDYDHFSAGIHL
ncbi:hypothetical protein [Paenibacillus sp. J2TS4]|uniref:hypothetical protein n=1 Tax=Paenibacillus sp. J2TS4 TaxID=2807194 RepID=UPI001B01C35F|nr:hypothetical protein [Paenibacillus sp. J2TS4]GIP34773.1 hypothetical protein J2TS4_39830 [Paenibacillus sp. J2TS4]